MIGTGGVKNRIAAVDIGEDILACILGRGYFPAYAERGQPGRQQQVQLGVLHQDVIVAIGGICIAETGR